MIIFLFVDMNGFMNIIVIVLAIIILLIWDHLFSTYTKFSGKLIFLSL